MTNADKFKGVFGIYATELWAKMEKAFLEWLNEDIPDTNVGDTISRQMAIDAIKELCEYYTPTKSVTHPHMDFVIETLQQLPSAEPERKGKWIDASHSLWDGATYWYRECNQCGYKRADNNPDKDTNFCPNCGARMMKGEQNE